MDRTKLKIIIDFKNKSASKSIVEEVGIQDGWLTYRGGYFEFNYFEKENTIFNNRRENYE